MMLPDRTFFILGPTAAGKTAIALALAERVGGEIVNADAFQLYRGLDVLTAKPSAAEMQCVPHHLYGLLESGEHCDAQRYRDLAMPIIHAIAERGAVPIIVGGSGLYVKAVTHGLAALPAADTVLRAKLARLSLAEQAAWLLQLDPIAKETVNLLNPRYVERALEICILTGRPQSELRQTFAEPSPILSGIHLQWERETLYERINRRVVAMFAAGIINEVKSLGNETGGVARAIGVKEVRALIAGEMDEAAATAALQQATRRYAKRQGTWFRREQWLQTICLNPESTPESTATQILTFFPCLTTPITRP